MITENVAKLGLKEEEINEVFENVQNFHTSYTDNAVEKAGMSPRWDEEELREAEFEEFYFIRGTYFEVLFSLGWEKELSGGKAPPELVNKFREKGISLPEHTLIDKRDRGEWVIGSQKRGVLFRIQKEGDNLCIRRARSPTISVFSTLDRFSTGEGAVERYASNYERLENEWENYYDYNPEEKAKEMLGNEKLELGDEFFMRYYKRRWNPRFQVTFRIRNVIASVSVGGDVPDLTEKTIELVKILENRLEER